MCAAGYAGQQAATGKLPVSTPATAALEFAAGGRDPIQNFKETTGAGQTFFPVKPQAPAARKKAKRNSGAASKRTGGGLRANNPALQSSGLQIK